jgi:hypothetical protein
MPKQECSSLKRLGHLWLNSFILISTLFWGISHASDEFLEELLVVAEKQVTSRVLWGIYDTSKLDLDNPQNNPSAFREIAASLGALRSQGEIAFLVRPKIEDPSPQLLPHEGFEVISHATFEKRFGKIDLDYFLNHLPTDSDENGDALNKKPLAAHELFRFTDPQGRRWAVLDMTPYDTVEKLHHVHPDIGRLVRNIRRLEAAGEIAYLVQEKYPKQPFRPAQDILVLSQTELFRMITHNSISARFRWGTMLRRLSLLKNQYIRPGVYDTKVLAKGATTFSGIFLWSAFHPVIENRVPVEQAMTAALVGGLWAGFIVYHSQSFRNVFTKPNRPLSVFAKSFLHSVAFGFIITSLKAWNFDMFDVAVWTHLGFHSIKSTWAKFKWKGLIKKVQDRARNTRNGVISQARTHDFAFEMIYDFIKSIDLLDVNDQKHTEGKSVGGELLFWGGVMGVYAYYAYEMLYNKKLMKKLSQGSQWKPWVITKFFMHSTYMVPAWFAFDTVIGVKNIAVSSGKRLLGMVHNCPGI